MRTSIVCLAAVLVGFLFAAEAFWAVAAYGQTTAEASADRKAATVDDKAALYEKFTQTLSGAKLQGNFTIVGRDMDKLPSEEYHIKSVRKLDEGEMWLFTARIKYGGKDLTVPLPLEVQWAGDTPVITLTDFAIPGLGTFSSRVVIYNNKYAGTWTHDDVGGHLFGTIIPDAAEDAPSGGDDSEADKKSDKDSR